MICSSVEKCSTFHSCEQNMYSEVNNLANNKSVTSRHGIKISP